MLIYLDNCCFNRPFDNQSHVRIRIETDAKLYIQENIIKEEFDLAWSYILDYENSENPFPERRETINNWKKYAKKDASATKSILKLANQLLTKGIKPKDALHVACAVELKCNYFITTDLQLIKKLVNFEQVIVVNPVDFINWLETK